MWILLSHLTGVKAVDLRQAGVEAEGVVSPVSAGCAADVVTPGGLTLQVQSRQVFDLYQVM